MNLIKCYDGYIMKEINYIDLFNYLRSNKISKNSYYRFKFRNIKCKIMTYYHIDSMLPIFIANIYIDINSDKNSFVSQNFDKDLVFNRYNIKKDYIEIFFNEKMMKFFCLPNYAQKKCMEVINSNLE